MKKDVKIQYNATVYRLDLIQDEMRDIESENLHWVDVATLGFFNYLEEVRKLSTYLKIEFKLAEEGYELRIVKVDLDPTVDSVTAIVKRETS